MKRIAKNLLDEYLGLFPCVAILGPRQCGKTTLLHTLGPDWTYFDLDKGSDFPAAADDPDLFLRLNPNRLAIDEAQQLPSLFPALRVAIDANRNARGRFVITGSSSPNLLHAVSESLAGRIGIIELSPLMWSEVHGGEVSEVLRAWTGGEKSPRALMELARPRASIEEAMEYWFRGGYPEPWLRRDPRFFDRWADQYTQTYLHRDVARLFPSLNEMKFRLFIRMLGGLSGRILNYAEVARALGVSQPTAREYLEIAHGTFLWRTLPAYHRNVVKRVVRHPRGHLRDSGLLHHLLRIPDLRALRAHPQGGASWQGLVIEEIIRQFHALGVSFEASHYRTSGGAEVDLVCESAQGLLPIEIKQSQRVDTRDLRGIRDFVEEHACPLGLVITNDERPRLYDEQLLGLPFAWL